jgi:hypothetical protein
VLVTCTQTEEALERTGVAHRRAVDVRVTELVDEHPERGQQAEDPHSQQLGAGRPARLDQAEYRVEL